jgi:hypothetical protein
MSLAQTLLHMHMPQSFVGRFRQVRHRQSNPAAVAAATRSIRSAQTLLHMPQSFVGIFARFGIASRTGCRRPATSAQPDPVTGFDGTDKSASGEPDTVLLL